MVMQEAVEAPESGVIIISDDLVEPTMPVLQEERQEGTEGEAAQVPPMQEGTEASPSKARAQGGLWSSLRSKISHVPLCGRGTIEESRAWAKERLEAYHAGNAEPAHDRLFGLLAPTREPKAEPKAFASRPMDKKKERGGEEEQEAESPTPAIPPSGTGTKVEWAHQRLAQVKIAIQNTAAKNGSLIREIGLLRLRLTVAHIMMADLEEHFVGSDHLLSPSRSEEEELDRQMESGWMTHREKQAGEEILANNRQVRVASGQLHGLQHTMHRVLEEQDHLMKEWGLMWLQEAWLEARWWHYHDKFKRKDADDQRQAERMTAMKKIEDDIGAVAAEDIEARRARRERLGLGEFAGNDA